MPLTKLDDVTALVLIDLQKGVVGMQAAHPAAQIIVRAARLAQAFREKKLPVVLVNVDGMAPGRTDAGRPNFAFPPDWTEFVSELERQPSDHIVTKQRWGAFIGTDMDSYLRRQDVTQVVIGGIATSAGVESTARSAFDHGYSVTFVVDAMTDRSEEMHRHCAEKIFPRLGETGATDDVLRLLKERRM